MAARPGDAAGAGAAVHPDVLDAELGALAHRVLGDLGPRSDHHRLHPTRDRFQIRVAAIPLNLTGVGVDREDVVPPLAQALIDDIAAVPLRVPGDPCYGDPFVGQER